MHTQSDGRASIKGAARGTGQAASGHPRSGGDVGFLLVIYHVPPAASSVRVSVWRRLKKLGAVYLQQAVCAVPDVLHFHEQVTPILDQIKHAGGTYHLLPLRDLPADERSKLTQLFRAQTAKQYREIQENCEVDFSKEIEFELFRGNLSYEEAEEIRSDFDKIKGWYRQVRVRDLFGAPGRRDAVRSIAAAARRLRDFERRVYQAQAESLSESESDLAPDPVPWQEGRVHIAARISGSDGELSRAE